jgi:hypothetical protein
MNGCPNKDCEFNDKELREIGDFYLVYTEGCVYGYDHRKGEWSKGIITIRSGKLLPEVTDVIDFNGTCPFCGSKLQPPDGEEE